MAAAPRSSQSGSAQASRNGSLQDTATPIETHGDGPSLPESDADESRRDAISEGKQKAKAVLAASGVTVKPVPEHASPSETHSPKSRDALPRRPRPTTQQLYLGQYVTRDLLYSAALYSQSKNNAAVIKYKSQEVEFYDRLNKTERRQNPGAIFGQGFAGYGNGHTDGKSRIVYPCQRKRPGGRKTRELRIPRKDMTTQAEQLEELIPVRLDIDWDKIKLRDTFTWNLHDRVISPELFAEQLVEDFNLPPETAGLVTQFVAQSLSEQIQDFYPQVFIEEEALDPHLPYHAYKNDEMRVLIKLNITIGQHTLVDQFEWEINNPLNSPEEFALQMTKDLSLSGEFTTAIAHCIREQSQLFTKSLYITGHPFDGRPMEDADLKDAFLPSPLPQVFRPAQHAKEFAPYLWELNEAELERAETSLSREQRRQKRSVNRRGGPALPDLKDRPRTVRTLILSSVLPGAAESVEDSRMLKKPEGGAGRPNRRAATKAGVDDSETSDSEDSAPDSPSMSAVVVSGSGRTRGIRGAASAAQLAMRANMGRSATPEAATLHHHETRTSARRIGGRDREDSLGDGSTFIVRLKIGKDNARRLEREKKAKSKGEHLSPFANAQHAQLPAARVGTPTRGSMGPPSTPGLPATPQGGHFPAGSGQPATPSGGTATSSQLIGAVDAPPPAPGQPGPPPPAWLLSQLATLRTAFPNDEISAVMRYVAVDTSTNTLVPSVVLQQYQGAGALPPHIKHQYVPRIRCHDCPGKLYTVGPDSTLGNFEVHLKNSVHRKRVEERLAGAAAAGASIGSGG